MRRSIAQVRALLRGDRVPLAVATGARPLKLNVPPGPDVPIYLAALGDAATRLAGEVADGWMPFLYPLRRLSDGLARLREGAARGGHPDRVPQIFASVPTVVAADAARARAGARSRPRSPRRPRRTPALERLRRRAALVRRGGRGSPAAGYPRTRRNTGMENRRSRWARVEAPARAAGPPKRATRRTRRLLGLAPALIGRSGVEGLVEFSLGATHDRTQRENPDLF